MKFILSVIIAFNVFTSDFNLTTYNVGLAHTYVPYASERLPFIINALEKDESDVLCLQEVWRAQDRDQIIKSLAHKYQFSHFEKVKQEYASKKPTCKIKNLFGKDKFVTCTQKLCKNKDGDDFTDCVINECREPLKKLKSENRQCAKALMAQVGKSSTKAIWTVVNPFKAASLFSYGGGNGLLILSKKKINNPTLIDFTKISTLNRRAALGVEIDGIGKVLCTHLTADLESDAPYAGDFSSWGEENEAQVEKLIIKANQSTIPTYIAGDFNCGPENIELNISGELAKNCEKFDAFFTDNLALKNPSCTFCSENEIAGTEGNFMIDHIYSSTQVSKSVNVVFKEIIEFDGIKSNLSDHYGIKAQFSTY